MNDLRQFAGRDQDTRETTRRHLADLLSKDLAETNLPRRLIDDICRNENPMATCALEFRKSVVFTLSVSFDKDEAWAKVLEAADVKSARKKFAEFRPDLVPNGRTSVYVVCGDVGHNAIFPPYEGERSNWAFTPWNEEIMDPGPDRKTMVIHVGDTEMRDDVVRKVNQYTLKPKLQFSVTSWIKRIEVIGLPGESPVKLSVRQWGQAHGEEQEDGWIASRDLSWEYSADDETELKPKPGASPFGRDRRAEVVRTQHIVGFYRMLCEIAVLQMTEDEFRRHADAGYTHTLAPFREKYSDFRDTQ